MPELSPATLLAMWEQGQRLHPADRSILLLHLALPQASPESLAQMSLVERDALLFSLREALFGPKLAGFAGCPHCGAYYEYDLRVSRLRPPPGAIEPVSRIEAEGCTLEVRLPNSADLAAALQASGPGAEPDAPAMQATLIERCVRLVSSPEQEHAGSIPAQAWEAAANWLREQASRSEIELDFTCDTCGRSWQIYFDIGSFLWDEICFKARRLFTEIDALARVYGWSEGEILALAPARRQIYLEMVS